jgi:four helix bundle protein
MVEVLPPGRTANVVGKQILRSATSVAANYRAACISRSDAAMIAKLDIVLEEADETLFWEEMLVESGLVAETRIADLLAETREITAMTVASLKTLRARSQRSLKTRRA